VRQVPSLTLNNGIEMPQLGFGVWQIPDGEAAQAVRTALAAGYRSIDTAAIYGNEEGTGKAIATSGIARDEIFVTTKLWTGAQGYESTLQAFDASLKKLGLDYVDLYLIHWPAPSRNAYVDTYRAFEKIYADGRAKAIGVSNFLPEHLRRLADETSVVPAVNQIELHPQLQQAGSRAFHAEHGIITEAWSPLGQGKGLLDGGRDRPEAREIPRAGRAPLAPPAREHGDPQVRDPVTDRGEHRRVRLRAGRGRPGGPGRARRGPAPRRRPRRGLSRSATW
jgi:2,5-diketo-D-gluconate reductase A